MDETAFTGLYEKHRKTVYSVVLNYVKNSEDAMEILQEVFIKLLNNSPDFESDEHIKAWLIRVSVNACKNHLRNQKHFSDDAISEEIPTEDVREDTDLFEIVRTLPEKYRVPLHLFYYEDYSIKEIAKVTDTPEATVKVRLNRGKKLLRSRLNKEDWV